MLPVEYFPGREAYPVEAKDWVAALEEKLTELGKTYKIVWVAKPAAFDWPWIKCYYEMFKSANAPDIGFKAHCISTMVWAYCASHGIEDSRPLEVKLTKGVAEKHSHDALEDAREQADLFMGIAELLGMKL